MNSDITQAKVRVENAFPGSIFSVERREVRGLLKYIFQLRLGDASVVVLKDADYVYNVGLSQFSNLVADTLVHGLSELLGRENNAS